MKDHFGLLELKPRLNDDGTPIDNTILGWALDYGGDHILIGQEVIRYANYARYEDLPNAVKSDITRLEFEAYKAWVAEQEAYWR